MAVIDELVIIEKGESKIVDSAEDGIIDEIEIDNNTFHFAKENEVTDGVCDNAVAEPIIDMQVMGNSIQDGTPTPEVPIEMQSVGDKTKNLFNEKDLLKNNINRDYYTVDKDGVTLAISHGSAWNILEPLITLSAGTYSMSNTVEGVARVQIYDENNNSIVLGKIIPFSFTLTETKKLKIKILSRTSYPIFIGHVQIEKSEVSTEYEPYGYKIPVKLGGKNLFDKSAATLGKNLNASTGGLYNSPARCVSDYIEVDFSKQYTFIYSYDDNATRYLVCFDENKNYVTQREGYTIEAGDARKFMTISFTKSNIKYIRANCFWNADGTASEIDDFMIYEGSGNDTYEPYVEPITTNIYLNEPLRKVGDYADYIDFKNQKVYRKVGKYAFTGTESFAVSGATTPTSLSCFTGSILPVPKINGTSGLCNIGVATSFYNINNYNNGFFYNSNSNHFLKIQKSVIPNYSDSLTDAEKVALFKEYLASLYSAKTPVNILYELKEPTEETIELPEIATLDGTTIFNVETTIKPSEFKVTYWRQITP